MKKIIYIVMLGLFSSLAITSCTEEEVKPQSETSNAGGSAIDPKGS